MATNSQLVIPVVLWGKSPPTHCVSCVYLSRDQSTLITGCYDGQICLWQVEPETLKMIPRCLLVGHTAPILCLSKASVVQDNNYVVSSTESGEMCTWDLVDGKCRELVKLPYVHTSMQAYHMDGTDDVRLFCNGFYADILIMDPFSLEILYTLSSRVSPDWISALHVLRPNKRKVQSSTFDFETTSRISVADDVVLALTTTGTVKVWTLSAREMANFKPTEPILENESKVIKCLNALAMSCCSQNQRTVLIVTAKYWQIFDAGDFSVLCSVTPASGERWLSGHFLSPDRVLVWSDDGKGYLYKLPTNSVADSKDFHQSDPASDDTPFMYCLLEASKRKPVCCPPAMRFVEDSSRGPLLIRADSEGAVLIWSVPQVNANQIFQIKQQPEVRPLSIDPFMCTSIADAWAAMNPSPVGILDQLESEAKLTASIFLPQQGRLVVGREDGTIIIVPATQTVMLQLLHGSHQQYDDWPPHQTLSGHIGRVNCLLYPYHVHPRYDKSHLVSGGVDFAVCLWDLYAGSLLHRFCVHAGEIAQLLVPPNSCSTRVQKCICSVASDHSVTLLSLTERKCVVLASRHLFPVINIKWRPLDDFMIVGCSDGTVYVWQMETGHLDRVLHGISAEDVLFACDEHTTLAVSSGESGMANPAVHFFRGLRHRNINAIRHATQRGLHQLQQLSHHNQHDDGDHQKPRAFPLMIQGLRTNPKDPESHILCFDIEALIGILAKMKEGAENVQTKLQAKAESVGFKPIHTEGTSKIATGQNEPSRVKVCEANLTMEMGQLLLSLLHAWGLDPDLDLLCETKLGLLRPLVPVSFGVLSKAGYMTLMLPTWQLCQKVPNAPETDSSLASSIPAEMVALERATRHFTSQAHWELSTSITTSHLLAIIAITNTLMSMNNASFVHEQERNRKLLRQNTMKALISGRDPSEISNDETVSARIKQGWSLLATLHCVLLPDKVTSNGSKAFKKPQVEMMASRWQHHCVEVREAAQALLLAELGRLGSRGRKALVDHWAHYLPVFTQSETHPNPLPHNVPQQTHAPPSEATTPNLHEEEDYEDEEVAEELSFRKPSSANELRRKQATAIVLLGVIGAEFGQDVGEKKKEGVDHHQRRKSSIIEGFGIGNNNLARLTSQALTHLLLSPPFSRLPAHTPLRRAAIDLIGRGFTVWEPYVDVSKVLLGLLELCCEADKLVPSMTYGLPLTPAADSARTARHALTLIATARPAAFITTMAREVARFNTLAQNAQTLQVNLSNVVLYRAKPEILRCVELLIDKMHSEMADLLVEVVDVILHCVEPGHLKVKSLSEVFPAVCRFNQVSHCNSTRRIAVGGKNGSIALYELRSNKCQTIQAHEGAITANAFSPDGKFLVSYSCADNKLSFWQTSSGMFGLGNSQTRRVKSYSTSPVSDISRLNPMRLAKLVWINNRTVTLMLADGSETRFNI